ncbi:hypothetical protein FIBSPDRAFT_875820, partial [Athelia psychrophila]
MASQLLSPPETLTESLANSQSTPCSSTDRLQAIYPAKRSFGPSIPFDPQSWRAPLHRRGTSKTYERMEDLLREAGYKETQVFTPETERAEAEA